MRQYKFRGKNKESREWEYANHYGSGQQSLERFWMGVSDDLLDRETIGEWTGLKDKNGKDLDWWEGDRFKMFLRSTLIIQRSASGTFYFVDPEGITPSVLCLEAAKWAILPEKIGTIHDAQEGQSSNKVSR